jgi:Undecaprenyl-phosphate galactose phosphotransferase WbaP
MQKTIEAGFPAKRQTEPVAATGMARWTALRTNARLWMGSALFVSDMLCLLVAIVAALQIRSVMEVIDDPYYLEIIFLLAITLGLAFLRKGLYPAVGMNYVNELREIVSSASFAYLIVIGTTFLLKTTSIYSRLALLISWVLTLILIPTGRYLTRRILIRLHLWGEPVAMIGDVRKHPGLEEYFKDKIELGLVPVVVLADGAVTNHARVLEEIKATARRLSLSTALVVVSDLNRLDALVERYRFVFERVILIKDRNGSYSLHSLKSLDFSEILGLQVMNNLLNFWAQLEKRVVDVVLSTLGLVVLMPFFVVTSVLIFIDSPGRVFYRQQRLGRNGRRFKLLKFRTMHLNAGRILADEMAAHPELKKEWDKYQKLRCDPRVTRVGSLLRKFSLDELPQLWNVLKGEMSLVGPRPMLPDQRELYGETFREYVRVAPGITGLWQVSGRNECTFARRAELDREYIERWSLWLDIFTLLKTIKIVLLQRGAY